MEQGRKEPERADPTKAGRSCCEQWEGGHSQVVLRGRHPDSGSGTTLQWHEPAWTTSKPQDLLPERWARISFTESCSVKPEVVCKSHAQSIG